VRRPNGGTRRGCTTGYYKFEEDKKRLPEKQVESRRRFAEQLAESNAKIRAIFEALEQLPRHFTLDEIRKPFLVPCVVEDLSDMVKDDPEARRMLLAHSLGITDAVYGPRADARAVGAAVAEVVEEKPGETLDKRVRSPIIERLAEIEKLIVAKGFTPKVGAKSPENLTAEEQAAYLWHLYSLPDRQLSLPWEE
jgi:hypothetical protein